MTWSRNDLDTLFGAGRATAQIIIKAMGDLQGCRSAYR
jgi:hypothetical protein